VIPRILPYTNGENCLELLRGCRNQLVSIRGTNQAETVGRYIEWATLWAEQLSRCLFEAEINRLILTPRFYAILSNSGGSYPLSFPLVSAEMVTRQETLASSIEDLMLALNRWKASERLVVFDTNVYLHAPQLFPEFPLYDYCAGSANTHLMILMVNLDELDGQKRGNSPATTKERARETLRRVEELIRVPDQVVEIPHGAGARSVEVVLDPPGHVRLPRNDDEIIDRARSIGDVAGRKVTLITGDVGMLIRARGAGLDVHHIEWPDVQPAGRGRRV